MVKVVEVYVKNKVIIYQEPRTTPECKTCATGEVDLFRSTSKMKFREVNELTEDDQKALKMVYEVAKEKGWKVKVFNVSTVSGKLRAAIKGVKFTPTIVIGKQKIEGIPTKPYLLKIHNQN